MDQSVNVLSQLITELNQQHQMNLTLEDGKRCAFLDEQGIYFQLEQYTGHIVLSADIGKVDSSNAEQLMRALSLNTDRALDGACVALSPDQTVFLLLLTLSIKALDGCVAEEWLFPFIAKARTVSINLMNGSSNSLAQNQAALKWR